MFLHAKVVEIYVTFNSDKSIINFT